MNSQQWLGWVVVLFLVARANAFATGQDIVIPTALVKLMDHAEIATPEAGLIMELYVQEGDIVRADSPLVRLEDTDAVLGQQRAQREVDIGQAEAASRVLILSAEEDLKAAQSDLRRARESQQKFAKSISPAEMEQFELAVRKGELAVEQAEHEHRVAELTLRLKEAELAIASRMLGKRRIVAPFEGTVVQVYQRPGEWVEPGTRLLRLVRTDRLRVEAYVSVEYLAAPLEGREVTLILPGTRGKEVTMRGEVRFVSPEVDPVNRQVRLLAEFSNTGQQLRPGLSAKLLIHGGRSPKSE